MQNSLRKLPAQERKAAAKVLCAALREQIELLRQNPGRTKADLRLARKLADRHNRLLIRY